MLRLPELSYLRPRTVDEAVQALADYGPDAMPVAGGTDVIPGLKRRQFKARVLVALRGLRELRGVRGSPDEGLTIGALTTLEEVASHPAVRAHYPALAEAASQVATPPIRHMGTLGGNLLVDTRCNYYNQTEGWRLALGQCMKCDAQAPCRVAPGSERCLAVSSSDTAPVLVALGARVRLVGPHGLREVPVAQLYREDGIHYHVRSPDELLTEVVLPPADGLRSTYLKLRRRGAFDFPILGVAAVLRIQANQTVEEARLVLGAAGSAPVTVPEAGQLRGLPAHGQPLEQALQALAEAARRRARPVDNTDLEILYRKRMAGVLTLRAFRRLFDPAPL